MYAIKYLIYIMTYEYIFINILFIFSTFGFVLDTPRLLSPRALDSAQETSEKEDRAARFRHSPSRLLFSFFFFLSPFSRALFLLYLCVEGHLSRGGSALPDLTRVALNVRSPRSLAFAIVLAASFSFPRCIIYLGRKRLFIWRLDCPLLVVNAAL